MHLVLAVPDPVAHAVVTKLVERGEDVVVVAGPEFREDFPPAVRFFPGDAASIDFGLSGDQYRALLPMVSRIYLAQSGFSTLSDVEKSRSVRQAAEVREFVRAGGAPDGVVFLSSLLVFGNAPGRIRESDFRVDQRFQDEHEESLAVAERIIRSLGGERGLAILRSAPVVGSEATGSLVAGSPLAHLVRLFERSADERGFVFTDLPLRWDTVERVSEALVRLPVLDGARAYHLVDEEPFSDRLVAQWISEHYDKPVMENAGSARLWASLVKPSYPGSRAMSGWGVHFDRENAKAELGELLDRDEAAVLRRLFSGDPRED